MDAERTNSPQDRTSSTRINQQANIREDEIDLLDYFKVLCKRKRLILIGTVVPTVIVGLAVMLSPRRFKASYTYNVENRTNSVVSNWSLDEKNYRLLLVRFYSDENAAGIAAKLRERGLKQQADAVDSGTKTLVRAVEFEVFPPYIKPSRATIDNAEKLDSIYQSKAQLLSVTIAVATPKNIAPFTAAIRDNFENVMPLYDIQDHLENTVIQLRAENAGLEKNRFDTALAVKNNRSVLSRLKNLKTELPQRPAENVVLQLDIGEKPEYLPMEYQVQAVELKITGLEGELEADAEKHNFNMELLALNKKLLDHVKKQMSSYYTIQEFHSFLVNLADSYNRDDLKSYLNSYATTIDSRIMASAPVTERPEVHPVARDTVKKVAVVFAILLMISIFAAFLLEGIQKSQAQAS